MYRKALLMLFVTSALAAPAMAQDNTPWTGLYAGVHAGYGTGDVRLPLKGSLGSGTQTNPLDTTSKVNSSGFLGGAQIGYNYLLPSNWLLGLESDASLADITASSGSFGTLTGTPVGTISATANSSIRWLGTVRGRVGYVFANNMLAYATGGFAYGGVRSSAKLTASSLPGTNVQLIDNTIGTGWTVGTGIEAPVANHLTLRAEYLYAELGAVKLLDGPITINSGTSTLSGTASLGAEHTAHMFRIGLNYALN